MFAENVKNSRRQIRGALEKRKMKKKLMNRKRFGSMRMRFIAKRRFQMKTKIDLIIVVFLVALVLNKIIAEI